MTEHLTDVWETLEAGDVSGGIRKLRFVADRVPMGELAGVVGRAAGLMNFDDLVSASAAVADEPGNPQALYDFGYACIERGVSFLAVPALTAALRAAPASHAILTELVSAYEDESRHADAVRLLEEKEDLLRVWPERYLLVYNSIMAGDVERANRHAAGLTPPGDERWGWPYERVRQMLARIEVVRRTSPLDGRDLRGWHFALNGGVLTTLSPYAFGAGMTGRFAFFQDNRGLCLRGLLRLRLVLEAAGRQPRSVSLLPDRSSRILGLAAARVLGLPAEPLGDPRADTVIVAYHLGEADVPVLERLHDRAPNQLLVEHATCWTEPPPICPDVSTFLHQVVVPPWGERIAVSDDGAPYHVPPDGSSVEEIAAGIVAADPAPDGGDGETPDDPDAALAGFVSAAREWWPSGSARRDRMRSSGPVSSSRFL
jgi:hypothetical protein